MNRTLPIALLVLVLAGCGGGNKQVVGKWTGSLKPAKDSKTMESAFAGLAGAFLGDITLEFNEQGKFKQSVSLGAVAEGTYSVSGKEVTLTPDNGKKAEVFIIDGDTLRNKKDFESDPDIVLKHQSSG